jgi:hypothetical protein
MDEVFADGVSSVSSLGNAIVTSFVTPDCECCGKSSIVMLPRIRFERWQSGQLVQDVFPDLSVDLRELLLYGTHPACWVVMYGGTVRARSTTGPGRT